jgi:hypothetical protein
MTTKEQLLQEIAAAPDELITELISFLHQAKSRRDPVSSAWPIDFFETTAGCLADDPIDRAPQGEYEYREPLV